MPAYSFKERFIPLIKSGEKKQTIRGFRRHQAKPGDTLYLYYGMRTKHCMKIMETVCTHVNVIEIGKNGGVFLSHRRKGLEKQQKEQLAIADGFPDFNTMLRWWKQTHSLPFKGNIIYWK